VPESSGVDLEGGAIDVDVCDSCYWSWINISSWFASGPLHCSTQWWLTNTRGVLSYGTHGRSIPDNCWSNYWEANGE
jgi:hypothetical protein